MAEKEKKAKAPSKPRKVAAKKETPVAEVTAIDHAKDHAKVDPPKNEHPKIVSHDEVARLAHHFWTERGHQHGNPAEDWFRAEHELRGKAS